MQDERHRIKRAVDLQFDGETLDANYRHLVSKMHIHIMYMYLSLVLTVKCLDSIDGRRKTKRYIGFVRNQTKTLEEIHDQHTMRSWK